MPSAAPIVLVKLADYQGGAVVSRILLKRGGGTMTLFAFDEGQSLSEHTAPFDAVAHVLEGEPRSESRERSDGKPGAAKMDATRTNVTAS
jgi:quercetin dioxygenase-like cupin family protein